MGPPPLNYFAIETTENMNKDKLSRRDFFIRATAVGVVSVGSGTLVGACGGGESQSQSSSTTAANVPADEPETMVSGDCTDTSGLTEAEMTTRTSLQYVDETPNPDQRCDNCQLYVVPEEGADCGACQIIKGPIDPAGYCISWAAKAS